MDPTRPLSFDDVRSLAAGLPDVSERLCYGTPTLFVRKVVLARLREDGRTLAVKCDPEEREFLLETRPETFFITDHYLNSTMVLVSLDRIEADDLATLIEHGWLFAAPRRLVNAYQASRTGLSLGSGADSPAG